jgi:hypothetical protein
MKAVVGLLVAAMLAFGSGCAKTDWIDRTLVTVDVTGTGQENWPDWEMGMSGDIGFDLEQRGSVVNGSLLLKQMGGTGDVSGPIEGTVAGDVFRFRDRRGNVEGELTLNGDEMTGLMSTAFG